MRSSTLRRSSSESLPIGVSNKIIDGLWLIKN
jgi:hypothetical protein